MLRPYNPPQFSEQDTKLFDTLVPFDHWTRRADKFIDFPELRKQLEHFYDRETGRPAIEPVLFLKIELLMFHDRLSDSEVFERAQTDLAYRRLLGLGRHDDLPNITTLGKFRLKLGADGHQSLFHALVAQARQCDLVKDRLRLKDATHIHADIAVPPDLSLVAQARNKLLNAAQPFAQQQVAAEKERIEIIRKETNTKDEDVRVQGRVQHLRDILQWAEKLETPPNVGENTAWRTLTKAVEVARKVLAGQGQTNLPGKLRSTVDPDARRGKHGAYYDGYLVDVLIDADSELITAINVMPADGNESADALALIRQEESAQGNDIENLSIDGAGYDGPVIRQLESSDGFGLNVFVPPRRVSNGGKFTSEQFELSEDGSYVICPNGERSYGRQRMEARHTTSFRFPREACQGCPLIHGCIHPNQKNGRTVKKNDYEPEYQKVRDRASTEEYQEVKREHSKVERGLGKLINRHGCRRARYRGLERVTIQQILGAFAANVSRMIRLLDSQGVFGLA